METAIWSASFRGLIEIGVDVLNPVQPECVDPFKVKELYGDRLSFWGCVGTQTTMPFGTKEEIFDVCKRLICEVGERRWTFCWRRRTPLSRRCRTKISRPI